jgi:hypothetical protein
VRKPIRIRKAQACSLITRRVDPMSVARLGASDSACASAL